jgi:hypothetical protein
MYKVNWNASGVASEKEVENLDSAMSFAKELNCLVTITGNGMEIVGLFGSDSVKDGKCPDGTDYTWMKRRTQ